MLLFEVIYLLFSASTNDMSTISYMLRVLKRIITQEVITRKGTDMNFDN